MKEVSFDSLPHRTDIRFASIFNAINDNGTHNTVAEAEATNIKASVLDEADSDKAYCIVKTAFLKAFANIVNIIADDIGAMNTASYYGLDSMIGAKLRTWIMKELGIDFPLLQLLNPALTLDALVERIWKVFIKEVAKG